MRKVQVNLKIIHFERSTHQNSIDIFIWNKLEKFIHDSNVGYMTFLSQETFLNDKFWE